MGTKKSQNTVLFLKGMAMGMADLVPGVSGGTIALITGIYEELIQSIAKFNVENLKLLLNNNPKQFWVSINGKFLVTIFSGILSSIIFLSFFIKWLIENQPIAIWSFFFGLLTASIFILKKEVLHWNTNRFLLLFAGIILAFSLTQISPNTQEISLFYLFICGMIGIIAMILPGISGAYLLLILGAYTTLLTILQDAIRIWSNFQFNVFITTYTKLLVFCMGAIIGLRSFASVLKWMLAKHNDKTMALLIGLMIGALHKIWPWQQTEIIILGEKTKTLTQAIMPQNYGGDPQIFIAILLFIVGGFSILMLERNKNRKINS